MKPSLCFACLLSAMLALLLATGHARADANTDLTAAVQTLGRISGQALACKHVAVATRVKTLMISRVPKTREFGEMFETATTKAFLSQGGTPCPSVAALTVDVELATRSLAVPNPHQLVAGPETPEVGVNPRYLLQATNGRSIMDSDFRDRFQLITFGYTFCPDICPTTLLEMTAVLKQLGDQAHRVQPIFISVDPERDTAKHLHEYVGFFDPRIIGATGSAELVSRAARNFKVRYEKVIDPQAAPGNYAVDHSAGMYLLAPGGQFITKFAYGMPVADIVSRLTSELRTRVDPAVTLSPVVPAKP
jgi:protein SCO1/2